MKNIGIICPSEIAFRRFMPALRQYKNFNFVGLAYANEEEWFGKISENNNKEILQIEKSKAENFVNEYGGELFDSYISLLESDRIDAVYLPLPPALHYKWGKIALENGKHLLCEKPFTTRLSHTEELIKIAEEKNLAIHENYMFKYHSQLTYIKQLLSEGVIGEIRLIRINFGFPFRGANDFRYNKALGGGALLDCGGYTIKLAYEFLGESAKVVTSYLNYKADFDVDLYGSATVVNDNGMTAQLAFGMDNSYKCDIEIWGSTGTIYTNRILTAPVGFEPLIVIKQGNEEKTIELPSDDTFLKSISSFCDCIDSKIKREANYKDIIHQAIMVDTFNQGEQTNV